MIAAVQIRSALIWAFALMVFPACAEQIVFQSTETPPYWSESLPDNGLGGEMLKLLSEEAGVQYSIAYLPIKRFRNSDATFIVGDPDMLIQQKRRAIFPVGFFHSAFFYYKPHHDVIEYRSLRDFRGHTLGVLRGTIEDKTDFVRNGIKVEESDSVISLVKKLKKGRVDFCITVAETTRNTIQATFPEEQGDFAQVAIPALDRPFAIMIDVENAEGKIIARRYRQVLEKTLRSIEYRTIVENFYGASRVPVDRAARLNKFIRQYESTWEN